MIILFKVLLVALVLTIGLMLICVFRGPSTFDRLNGIFVIGTDIIAALLLLGLIDGRFDMYVDIALSYAILGFLSTVFIANYLKGSDKAPATASASAKASASETKPESSSDKALANAAAPETEKAEAEIQKGGGAVC